MDRASGKRDAGASAIEWALLTPILIGLFLLVVQFAMVYHARHVALAAAQSGARVARTEVEGPWERNAESKAGEAVQRFGSRLLTEPVATASTDGDSNRWVDVDGKALRVIPFMTFRVHQRAGGPIECFRPDDGGTNCEGAP